MKYVNEKVAIFGNNNVSLGYFVNYEDGRLQWQPIDSKWCYTSQSLREIANGLDEYNAREKS